MDLLNLFTTTVFAAETIISPLPTEYSAPKITLPQVVSPLAPELVLGASTIQLDQSIQPTLTVFPTILASQTPTQLPTPTTDLHLVEQSTFQNLTHLSKKSYSIAFLGDSMIDTLGPTLPDLQKLLSKSFPQTVFTLINHGIGATTIETGKNHLLNSYIKGEQTVAAVLSTPPDILVIESFAYNPINPVEKHWLLLAEIVDSIKEKAPQTKILLATTIAPDPVSFAMGAPGISFSEQERMSQVTAINKLLENTISFAQSEKIPLADAYTASKKSGSSTAKYINKTDHIHYSEAGKILMSHIIFDALLKNKLF